METAKETTGPVMRHVLDLSTAHVPPFDDTTALRQDLGVEDPLENYMRVADHDFGWILFVPAKDYVYEIIENVKFLAQWSWLAPILKHAVDNDCLLINFDSAGPVYPGSFQTFEW
jgi:hypothetical protein